MFCNSDYKDLQITKIYKGDRGKLTMEQLHQLPYEYFCHIIAPLGFESIADLFDVLFLWLIFPGSPQNWDHVI